MFKRVLSLWATPGALVFICALAQAQSPAGPEARNMELVGYHDLQARSAYQPVVKEQNGRWIAYIGHHGGTERVAKPPERAHQESPNSTARAILDVTNPRAPRYLAHIPGEEGQGGERRRADGPCLRRTELPKADRGKFYLLRYVWQFPRTRFGM